MQTFKIDCRQIRKLRLVLKPGALVLFAAVAGAPLPALAECMTRQDVTKGLRATYMDGSVVDYLSEGADLVRVTETSDLSAPQAVSFLSRYGVYDLKAQGLIDGTPQPDQVLDYSYSDADGNEPPRPDPGQVWLGHSTTTYADGATDGAVAVMVFGQEGKLRLGDCDYAVVPVTASYLAGETWTSQDFDWLSDLGIGILTRREGSEAPRPSAYKLTGLVRKQP